MNFPNSPTFIIKTIGCKVNQYESEVMRERLLLSGLCESADSESADFYIINSCTVTHKADRDTRRLIRHFHGVNPKAKIVVAGCYAELDEDRRLLSQIPGVSCLVRNKEKERIEEILGLNPKSQIPNPKQITNYKLQITNFKDRDRAFVKVQDGCNHRCSYCKVALVRGPSISRCEDSILNETTQLIKYGYKEIVLTGICLGAWGKDFKSPIALNYLLDKIASLKGDFRLRLSSIEPVYVTDELIYAVSASSKICKHFHIPLQSGDDKILRKMNKSYNTKQFLSLLKKIRKRLPEVAFTTDIMVGFPVEDNNSFRRTYKFIKKTRPSRTHIFTYSKRRGTRAYEFGEIPDSRQVKIRKDFLKGLTHSLEMQYAGKFKDKNVWVLVESKRDKFTQLLTGYTDTYIKVLMEGSDRLLNCLIPARITEVSEKGIFATPAYLDKEVSV